MMRTAWARATVLMAMVLGGPAMAQSAASATQTLREARPRAVDIVLDASRSADGWTRGEAVDAAQWLDERVLPIAQLGLSDTDALVRYQALLVVGKRELESLGDQAAQLVTDPSPSVRAAALFAAGATGRTVEMSPAQTSGMINAASPIARSNVALALGLAGNRSALPVLSTMAATPMPRADPVQRRLMQLRIAEARLTLGQDDGLDVIRWAAFGGPIELRVLAIGMMADTGDRAMQPALPPMLDDPSLEVRLAAATALLRFGDDSGLAILEDATGFAPADARQQAEAALRELRQTRRQNGLPQAGDAPSKVQREAGQVSRQLDRTNELERRLGELQTVESLQRDMAANIRSLAAYGLSYARDASSAQQLVALLDDAHPQVRLAAAAGLLRRLAH